MHEMELVAGRTTDGRDSQQVLEFENKVKGSVTVAQSENPAI
jgi:hypothetical protein